MRNAADDKAGEQASGVIAVTRALSLMEAFEVGESALSGPSSRLTKATLERHARNVIRAANQLSYALAGTRSAATPAAV